MHKEAKTQIGKNHGYDGGEMDRCHEAISECDGEDKHDVVGESLD